MAMSAYNKAYLNNAATTFGCMMDYVVNSCGIDGDDFLRMFIASGLAEKFERGNPQVIAGMSGAELAGKAIRATTGQDPLAAQVDTTSLRTPEYWAGWALAHYQWRTARSFSSILRTLPFSEIEARYYPLHEADISKFYSVADNMFARANPQTNLKRLREVVGLSQSRLAEESEVSLRSIQMYEQRNKDVNKAQAITLAKIARVLGCEVEDLLEAEALGSMASGNR